VDAWIHGYVEKCQENYGLLFNKFEGSAAVRLQYSPLKYTPHNLDVP
jgi:hypothetical protein